MRPTEKTARALELEAVFERNSVRRKQLRKRAREIRQHLQFERAMEARR
jgi:hypothetical protein